MSHIFHDCIFEDHGGGLILELDPSELVVSDKIVRLDSHSVVLPSTVDSILSIPRDIIGLDFAITENIFV